MRSQNNRSKNMKIGLVGAMHEEILMLKDEMKNVSSSKIGPREYFEGQLNGCEVVMCLSGWGKVAASSTATTMINHFKVNQLIFVGLAGALNNKLEIGDIVIGNKLIQHDVDLSLLNGFQQVQSPFWKDFSFAVNHNLVEKAQRACNQFIQNINSGYYKNLNDNYKPKVSVGSIGTGDQFVASNKGKQQILKKYPAILCTEMEGAAIAQVAADYEIDYLIVRIISDKADEHANTSFSDFLFENISEISVEIVKLLVK